MPVAKSFQSMKIVVEPFVANDKMYVVVLNEKTNKERTVRWYTDKEYAKLYPEEKIEESNIFTIRSQKDVLGFEKGYITIFKGDIDYNNEWFRECAVARYTRWWGWYVISTDEVPKDLPNGVEPVRLEWSSVGNEDTNTLKRESEVYSAVNAILYDDDDSQYQGKVGERIDIKVVITANFQSNNSYGDYTTHYMKDECGNRYMWNTSSRNWPVGAEKHIRGTVKEHRTIKNNKTTILTRCSEVK